MSTDTSSMYVLGLMSGSSLDGLDIAVCRFGQDGSWQYIQGKTYAFTAVLQEGLEDITSLSLYDYQQLDVRFCRFCTDCVAQMMSNLDHTVDLISSHGHTVLHHPELGFSLQMGNGAHLSAWIGLPVVTDFRQGDVALGGQGAPMVSLIDRYLYHDYDAHLNLGGIANVSINTTHKTLAFDICPCNQILNNLARQKGQSMDVNGDIARSGTVQDLLLDELFTLDYFQKESPKSLDNRWVQSVFWPIIDRYEATIEDKMATMVECISRSIADQLAPYQKSDNQSILVTGGGAHNRYLYEEIAHKLVEHSFDAVKPDNHIINFKEAILMAYMGYLRWNKNNNILNSATGAQRDSIGGAIYEV